MELEKVLQVSQFYCCVCCAGISRTSAVSFPRAVLQRRYKLTQQYRRGGQFCVVLLPLEVQDAMRAAFDVWPAVGLEGFSLATNTLTCNQKEPKKRQKNPETCMKS